MPGAATAELIFITAMMIGILIISFAAVYFFFRQYNREKAAREAEKAEKAEKRAAAAASAVEMNGEKGPDA